MRFSRYISRTAKKARRGRRSSWILWGFQIAHGQVWNSVTMSVRIKVYILMRYITRNTFKTERYRHDRNDDFIFANDRRSFVSRMPQGGTLNVTKIHSDCVSVHVSKDFVYNFIHDIDVYRVDLFLIHWRSCLHSRVKDRTENREKQKR